MSDLIVTKEPLPVKQRFIKLIVSEETDFIQENYPNVMLLLMYIARHARRVSGKPDGLEIGEALIGDYRKCGIESEKRYRTAKLIAVERGYIEIVETNRTRTSKMLCRMQEGTKRATERATAITTNGTKVKLLGSRIWDINAEADNEPKGDHKGVQRATEGRPIPGGKLPPSSLLSPIPFSLSPLSPITPIPPIPISLSPLSTPPPSCKKEKKEKKNSFAQTTSSPRKAVDISFSFENMKFTCIAEADMISWAIAYPSVNLKQEIAKAEEWCKANPQRAKPKKLWRKFLTNWFNKANDNIDNKRAYQSMNGKKVGYGIATGEYDNVF